MFIEGTIILKNKYINDQSDFWKLIKVLLQGWKTCFYNLHTEKHSKLITLYIIHYLPYIHTQKKKHSILLLINYTKKTTHNATYLQAKLDIRYEIYKIQLLTLFKRN